MKEKSCSTCVYKVNIMRHPWNRFSGGRMKGPVTQIAGMGCTVLQSESGGIIFFERDDDYCEEYTERKENEQN